MLVFDIEVVIDGVRPCPFAVVGLRESRGVGVVVDDIAMESVIIAVYEGRVIVEAEIRAEYEALEGLDVDEGIAE